MRIGVPKEIKNNEFRVGLTPASVAELVHAATVAIVGKVPLTTLWHAVPSYPTMSEIWLRVLERYGI